MVSHYCCCLPGWWNNRHFWRDYGPDNPRSRHINSWPHHQCDCRSKRPGRHGCVKLLFLQSCSLPVPWLLFCLINGLQPVPVSSNGLFCAIVLLFLMLLFVISSIASCKWRMNKILGFTMFLLYFVFLIISVMLEDRIISCPVSVWVKSLLLTMDMDQKTTQKLLYLLWH